MSIDECRIAIQADDDTTTGVKEGRRLTTAGQDDEKICDDETQRAYTL